MVISKLALVLQRVNYQRHEASVFRIHQGNSALK